MKLKINNMILTFLPQDLIHIEDYYYSSPFSIKDNDTTIQITTSESLTLTIEASIDDIDYFELPDTSFNVTSAGGIQSYVDGQEDLLYRLKLNALPTLIKILV